MFILVYFLLKKYFSSRKKNYNNYLKKKKYTLTTETIRKAQIPFIYSSKTWSHLIFFVIIDQILNLLPWYQLENLKHLWHISQFTITIKNLHRYEAGYLLYSHPSIIRICLYSEKLVSDFRNCFEMIYRQHYTII